jgi:hypothetical protein
MKKLVALSLFGALILFLPASADPGTGITSGPKTTNSGKVSLFKRGDPPYVPPVPPPTKSKRVRNTPPPPMHS